MKTYFLSYSQAPNLSEKRPSCPSLHICTYEVVCQSDSGWVEEGIRWESSLSTHAVKDEAWPGLLIGYKMVSELWKAEGTHRGGKRGTGKFFLLMTSPI